jgi:hypothetical protein
MRRAAKLRQQAFVAFRLKTQFSPLRVKTTAGEIEQALANLMLQLRTAVQDSTLQDRALSCKLKHLAGKLSILALV